MNWEKLGQLYISFFKIGALTFGGGYAMLPMLQREVVEQNHYATEEELLDYYAVGQCTPGVIAVNCATFVGEKEGGFWGALAATLGVLSPSILIILLVASVLARFMDNPYVLHALAGVRVIVTALILNSVIKMARKGIVDWMGVIILAIALVLGFFTGLPTVVIVLVGAAAGILLEILGIRKKMKNGGESK